MNRNSTAILPELNNYDHCLITDCLKKLFTKTAKNTEEPVLLVRHHIIELKKELEMVNRGCGVEMSYDYLGAMEQSVSGTDFRYAVIYKDNAPVLFAYFQLFTLTSGNFTFEKNKGFVKGLLSFFLDLKRIKVLISGNALRNETLCYCFNEGLLSNEEATEIISSAAEKIAADEHVSAVILKDISASGSVKKWLGKIGYHMPWEDKTMVMNIDSSWQSLADYTAALSRKYKTRANKILADGKGITVKMLSESEIKAQRNAINKLFKNVADNQSFTLTSPSYDHFAMLKRIYGDDFEFCGFFNGTQLVAFSSAFITPSAYELYYVGIDYDHNSEFQLYFNILFSGLSRSIELKKQQLKLGRTSFDAKASIGAKPAVMNYLVKLSIPNIVSNWFINYFSSMEDAKWKLRNPLKQPVAVAQ